YRHSGGVRTKTAATSGRSAAAPAATANHNRRAPWAQDHLSAGSTPAICVWLRRLSTHVGRAGPSDSTRLHRQTPKPTLAGPWLAGSAGRAVFFFGHTRDQDS